MNDSQQPSDDEDDELIDTADAEAFEPHAAGPEAEEPDTGNESPFQHGHVESSTRVTSVDRAPRWDGPPVGIRRGDRAGLEWVDALAGRSSVFGFGFHPVIEAIQKAAQQYLGDAAELIDHADGGDDLILRQLQELLGDSQAISTDSLYLTSSADLAVETAVELARKRKPDVAYRMITAVGSDHGRSGVCRIASGRPELHEGYGPMMAGFAHVPTGDIDALRATIDEQTCGVMLSPIDFGDAARPLTADYLLAVREACDESDLVLIFDESRIGFGTSASPLAFAAIADIHADAVILGGGLFGGLPGGAVIASTRLTGSAVMDTSRFPLLAAAASATLGQIIGQRLLAAADDHSRLVVTAVAELVGGFDFVRELHDFGTTIGIEMDIESAELVAAAAKCGLRLESAGEAAVRLQLPLVLSEEDRDRMLDRLRQSLEAIELATAEIGV